MFDFLVVVVFLLLVIFFYGWSGISYFDVWLTVHRNSMWNKKPTRCHLVLYLFLLYMLLNMFLATLCPSSGADDLVVFLQRVV